MKKIYLIVREKCYDRKEENLKYFLTFDDAVKDWLKDNKDVHMIQIKARSYISCWSHDDIKRFIETHIIGETAIWKRAFELKGEK